MPWLEKTNHNVGHPRKLTRVSARWRGVAGYLANAVNTMVEEKKFRTSDR